MNKLTYHIQVGEFDCYALADGSAAYGMEGAMRRFPSVPAEALRRGLLECGVDPDAQESYYNPLLIKSAENIILVDGGERPDRHENAGRTVAALAEIGIVPEDVDTVIITHAHGDHVVGLFHSDNETLRYPNARYVINRAEWDFWTTPERLAGSGGAYGRPAGAWLKRLESRMVYLQPDLPIVPGVTPVAAYGHTAGHTCLLIESGDQRLMHGVDLVHLPAQFSYPDWCVRFDTDSAAAYASRLRLFNQIVDEQLLTMFYHMPFPGVGTIERTDTGFQWRPMVV